MGRTFTHPDVLGKGVEEGWADPITDPTVLIDWAERQANALIPFQVINGRPVNPCEKTGITHGRNELGHWGEGVAADAIVTVDTEANRWLAMIERSDGSWAVPGGFVDPGESARAAAFRELFEETGLGLRPETILSKLGGRCVLHPARYVPDPRASDEAWIVTVPLRIHLGSTRYLDLPHLVGADDAKSAAWALANDYRTLVTYLADHGRKVFPAHQAMLADLL